VMWAVATRVRAEKDIVFIPGAKGAILDPTSDPERFTLTKMGIDATRPTGRDFAERLTISDDQRARARAILAAAGVKLEPSLAFRGEAENLRPVRRIILLQLRRPRVAAASKRPSFPPRR